MRRPSRLSALLLGGLCSLPAAIAAPATAETPRSVSAYLQPVAVSPGGELFSAADDIDPEVTIRTAPAGGVLGAPRLLSRNGVQPTIVAGPRGDAVALWTPSNEPWQALASFRAPGAAFGRPVVITRLGDPEADPGDVDAGFDAAGTATLAWSTRAAGVQVRTRSAAGVWSPSTHLDRRGTSPRLIVAPSGAATVMWTRYTGDRDPTPILAATRPAGGAFGAVRPVTTAGRQAIGLIAGNDRGDAAIVWEQDDTKRELGPMSIHAAFRTGAGGTFGPDTVLSRRGRHDIWPSASVGPDGRTVVAWTSFGRSIEARVRTAAGVLRPRRILSRHALQGSSPVALATGPGLVAWYDGAGTVEDTGPAKPAYLRTATATPAGAFGRAHTWFASRTSPETPFVFALGDGLLVMTPHGSIRRRATLP